MTLSGFLLSPASPARGAQLYDLRTLLGANLYLSKGTKTLPPFLRPIKVTRYPSGLEAAAFENTARPDNVLVSFRGTQTDDPRDIMADLGIVSSQVDFAGNAMLQLQVNDGLRFIDALATMRQRSHRNRPIRVRDITVTGCSLGGFITQAVTVQKKAFKGIAFNGPGALKFVLARNLVRGMSLKEMHAKVDNHRRKSDVVGNFGRHVGRIWNYPNYATKATFVGKPKGCGKGNFLDVGRKECWSCEGWTRTVYPVTGGSACARRVSAQYHRAVKKRKNSRVGQGCPKGQFWDVKGGKGLLGACYTCNGDKRTAFAVNSAKACARPAYWQHKRAKFVRKFGLCPRGSFLDPRNLGECWSCPKGLNRGTTPVTAPDACVPPNYRVENHKCDAFYAQITRMRGVYVGVGK